MIKLLKVHGYIMILNNSTGTFALHLTTTFARCVSVGRRRTTWSRWRERSSGNSDHIFLSPPIYLFILYILYSSIASLWHRCPWVLLCPIHLHHTTHAQKKKPSPISCVYVSIKMTNHTSQTWSSISQCV